MTLCVCTEFRPWTFGIEPDMTEQEIVDYLKENKYKGVCVAYLPEDVVDFVHNHLKDMLIMNQHIGYGYRVRPHDTTEWWKKYDESNDDTEIYSHSIVTLPDDYTIKGETNGKKK